MSTFHTVTLDTPATFVNANGTHYIWDDFTVRYDMNNTALTADTTIANTIAEERLTQYFAKIYRQTAGYMTQTYAGALPFATGSQVDGICWYQDYRGQDRQGWRTKIVRGDEPPFPEINI